MEKIRQFWRENKRAAIGIAVFAAVIAAVNIAEKRSGNIPAQTAQTAPTVETVPGKLLSSVAAPAAKTCDFKYSLAPARSAVLFKEIAWMGDKESAANEWLSIQKVAEGDLDVSGYQVVNESQKIKVVIPAGAVLTDAEPLYILARQYGISGVADDLIYSGALRNTGEGLRLFDGSCRLLDEVFARPDWPAGDNAAKETMKRNLGTLAWFTHASPLAAQGAATAAPPSSAPPTPSASEGLRKASVLIIEVVPRTESKYDAFIVLYNAGADAVDLTGWTLKKRASTGSESSLVVAARLESKIIPVGRYFLLANDSGYTGTVAPDATWAHSNTLAKSNNAVILYTPDGETADSAAWTEVPYGKSLARVSLDGSDFTLQDTPTPRNSQSQ